MLKPTAANALIAVALAFAVILAANVGVTALLMAVEGIDQVTPERTVGPGLVIQGVCMLFFVSRWAQATQGGAVWNLGAGPAIRWWLVLFIVPAGLLGDWVIQELVRYFPNLGAPSMDLLAGALESQRAWILIGAVGLAPFYEELLFRGLVWRGLERDLGGPAAWVGTTVLFAAFHMDPLQMAGVLFIGGWLGWIRLATGSVVPCIAAHLANNLGWALLGGVLPVSELPAWTPLATLGVLAAAVALSVKPPAASPPSGLGPPDAPGP